MATKFWMVWCPQGGTPTVRHHSREAADTEAARLAAKNPGKEFFVLKAVGGRVAAAPQVQEIELAAPQSLPMGRLGRDCDPDIPF